MNQTILSLPISVIFIKNFTLTKSCMPDRLLIFRLSHMPVTSRQEDNARSGVRRKAEMEAQMLDYLPYCGQVGVEFGNATIKLGVN